MAKHVVTIEGKLISISDPGMMLWPGITKLEYIDYLLTVSPFMFHISRSNVHDLALS